MVVAALTQVLVLLLSAALVYAVVRVTPVLFQGLVVSPSRREALARYGPPAELAAWVTYLALAGVWLWTRDGGSDGLRAIVLLVGLLGVMTLAGGWRTFRDYLSGVVLRSEGSWRVGDRVRVGDVEGVVLRLGYRTVELQRQDGDVVFVPYARLSGDLLVRRHAEGDVVRHTFVVSCPNDLGPAYVVPRVREAALLHHWSSPGHDPGVQVAPDGSLRVTIHALSEARVPQVEAAVRSAVTGPPRPSA